MTLTHEQYKVIGAIITGLASGGSAYFGVRMLIKRGEDECKKRFEAFREGMKVMREKPPE